jgi:hypothetical protein
MARNLAEYDRGDAAGVRFGIGVRPESRGTGVTPGQHRVVKPRDEG